MNKHLLSISLIFSLSLLTACGGGGSSSNTVTGESTGSGSTDGDSTADGSTADDSTANGSTSAGGSTAEGSTDSGMTDDSTNDGSTGGGSTSDSTNMSASKVLYDKTQTYILQGNPGTAHIKVTEHHQNNDSTYYNLWDYRFSPTKDSYRIFQDSYSKTISPPNLAQADDTFEQNAWETNIELDPRIIVSTRDNRKVTTKSHYPKTQLSGIRFSSISSRQFDATTTPPTLTGLKIKDEPEDLVTNQDPCASEIVSKGEILFSAIGEGLWQIGDKLTTELDARNPKLSCNDITVNPIETSTRATSTLTAYIPILTIRGKQFHNVLEFTDEASTVSAGKVILSSSAKVYLQYYTGDVVTSKTTCIGGALDSSTTICSEKDIIANNVPTIPES